MTNLTFQKFKFGGKDVVVVNYKQEKIEKTKSDIHHIQVIDRSLSMTYEIDELIDNVQQIQETISDNDLLTIVWFSSENQYRTVIKGAKKFDKLNDILNKLRSTIGTTCFSDPLKEVNEIIEEFKDIMPISVTLFTDGQPVVSWGEGEEKRRIFMEIEKMKDKVVSVNTVGYGNYYNERMLKDIAAFSEYGVFKHSNQINEYIDIFKDNYKNIEENFPGKMYVEGEEIIYLNRRFTKMSKNCLKLTSIDKEKNQFFVILKNEPVFTINDTEYKIEDIDQKPPAATINNFYYAYVYNKYYEGRRKESLDILTRQLFDKYLIDSHFNAFTYDECALHQKELKNALFVPKNRFKNRTCNKNYVPLDDALCVMDVIRFLKRANSLWVPFHKLLPNYKRIGRKAEDSFDIFIQNEEEIVAKFTDLVFNKSKSNMGIRVKINGMVTMNPLQARKVGLEPIYKTHKYRTYNLIKDGNLNMEKIMCLIPVDEYDVFRNTLDISSINMITTIERIDDIKYNRVIIDLTKFPIINRKYVNESKSIDTIFENTLNITHLEAKQKLINYYLKDLNKYTHLQKKGEFKDKTKDQIEVLKEHGIASDGSYRGIDVSVGKVAESDSYYTREIEFYLVGCTSMPKIEDYFERLEKEKSLTTAMKILNYEYNDLNRSFYERGFEAGVTKTKKFRDWLDNELKIVKNRLGYRRDDLSILKMAMILTGDWFVDLKVDDKNNYYYEKYDLTMICKAKRVVEYI